MVFDTRTPQLASWPALAALDRCPLLQLTERYVRWAAVRYGTTGGVDDPGLQQIAGSEEQLPVVDLVGELHVEAFLKELSFHRCAQLVEVVHGFPGDLQETLSAGDRPGEVRLTPPPEAELDTGPSQTRCAGNLQPRADDVGVVCISEVVAQERGEASRACRSMTVTIASSGIRHMSATVGRITSARTWPASNLRQRWCGLVSRSHGVSVG